MNSDDLLETHTIPQILDGTAGTVNAQRMASLLKTVVVVAEPVKKGAQPCPPQFFSS